MSVMITQAYVYVNLETKHVESVLLENKRNLAEVMAMNFGAAQSVGGFAYQTQLIDAASRTQDTVFVRFVRPDGTIFLSNVSQERGLKVELADPVPSATTLRDLDYGGRIIKVVVAPAAGGYSCWLGFSYASVQAAIDRTVLFRILLSLLSLSLEIGLATLIGFWVTGNLRRLKRLAEEVKRGNLTAKSGIKSSDEIGELGRTMDAMTDKLLESRERIDKKVKELSEERGKLSSLVESVKLGVVMVDLRLNVIMSNDAARAIFGKRPDSELTFKDLTEKTSGRVNLSQALSYYVKSGKPLNIQEIALEDRYYRLFMSPVRDIVEKIFIGAVVVIEDITKQKKIDQMRTEIVSITSHQLRTPATIVKGNLEMVLGGDAGKLSKPQKELIADAHMGNERMIRLINDLMDAAKINEGKMFLPLGDVHLEEVIQEIIGENQDFADEKKVSLSFIPSEKPLPTVKINRQKIKQVLQNLVDNAIKYSAIEDRGKVLIEVHDDKGFLRIMVRDNGIGIPAADQDKIFQRFSRGSNSTRMDPGGGSGLGLYIAKAVIEQAGGRIWFESKENEGTTFYATLPKNK